jgi:hypothetical protein
MADKEEKRLVYDLDQETVKDLKKLAKQSGIPTKTLTSIMLKNMVRRAKRSKARSLSEKIKDIFTS